FASSLCGACFEACPVKIDIPTALVHLRNRVTESQQHRALPTGWEVGMRAASTVLADGRRLGAAARAARAGRALSGGEVIARLPFPASAWTDTRDLPAPPQESFRAWWKHHQDDGAAAASDASAEAGTDASAGTGTDASAGTGTDASAEAGGDR
ncbi:DUF3390 domain-containing protein, partial [Georgenia sp. 10Sc9-8]|nr:DUF3390 domain-containing protein [Georgenia halotolerans]